MIKFTSSAPTGCYSGFPAHSFLLNECSVYFPYYEIPSIETTIIPLFNQCRHVSHMNNTNVLMLVCCFLYVCTHSPNKLLSLEYRTKLTLTTFPFCFLVSSFIVKSSCDVFLMNFCKCIVVWTTWLNKCIQLTRTWHITVCLFCATKHIRVTFTLEVAVIHQRPFICMCFTAELLFPKPTCSVVLGIFEIVQERVEYRSRPRWVVPPSRSRSDVCLGL